MADVEPARGRTASGRWRRWLPWLKLAVVALLVWGIHDTLARAVAELDETPVAIDYPWLVLAAGLYLLGMLPCGLFWHRVLMKLGQRPGLYQTLRAYYIGHLGKYVPGKALVVILRAGLLRSANVETPNVETPVAAVSVFLETLTQMAVGAAVAAVTLAILYREHVGLMALAIALAVAAGLPIYPPIFRRLVRLVGVGKKYPAVTHRLAALDLPVMLTGWPTIAAGWFAIGGSVWATTRAIGVPPGNLAPDLVTLTAAASLATVAGFLSLIPGGFGVRDVILLTLLIPYCTTHATPLPPEAAALTTTVLARVTWLAAEVAVAGILYPLRPR